jgi:hypothetical protein
VGGHKNKEKKKKKKKKREKKTIKNLSLKILFIMQQNPKF